MQGTTRTGSGAKRRGSSRCLAGVAGLLALALSVGAGAQQQAGAPPQVRVETTAGDFVIQLDPARAPLTVENFLRYVRAGFYSGLMMHRVIANFVVQGGGYTPDFRERTTRDPIVNESGNGLSNQRGSVGMARGEGPHSATAQFYVNLNDNPGLNPLPSRWGYAVFGQVVQGMDVIDRIAHVATGERAAFVDTPLEPIVIRRAVVVGETPAEPAPTPPAADGQAAGEGAAAAEAGAEQAGKKEPEASGGSAADSRQ